MRHRFAHILALSELHVLLYVATCWPAWHILTIPFLQALVPSHLCLVLRNRSLWPIGSVLDREVLIFTSGVHCVIPGGRLGGGE